MQLQKQRTHGKQPHPMCESQHVDYTQAKAKVMEALKNNDPQIMFIVRQLQQLGIR